MSEENFWVYILECSDKSLYTGIAKHVEKRLAQHGTKRGAKYMRSRLPFVLVFEEKCSNRSEASKREYEIKKMTRAQKRNLISDDKNLSKVIPLGTQQVGLHDLTVDSKEGILSNGRSSVSDL